MKREKVAELFRRLRALDPHPTTELHYETPFQLLLAVILSAQATDVGVNKATRRLFPIASTPQAILALGEEGLKPYIATIGLYNAKATPHLFVIAKDGTLAYQGAIDDQPNASVSNTMSAHNYVKAALIALKAGKPVEKTSTPSYGCGVKYGAEN